MAALIIVTALGALVWQLHSRLRPVYEGKTVEQWLTAAHSSDADLRERTAFALTQLPISEPGQYATAVSEEARLLGDPDRDVRTEAANGLMTFAATRRDTTRIAAALVALIRSRSGSPAWADAARALGRLGATNATIYSALRDLLRAPSPRVRSAAIDVLAGLGARGVSDIAAFARSASDSDANVRQSALAALTQVHANTDVAAPVTLPALADPDAGVREQAAYTLGALRPVPIDAINPLAQRLADPAPAVRVAAASALAAALPGRAARTALRRAVNDRDSAVSAAARAALRATGLP